MNPYVYVNNLQKEHGNIYKNFFASYDLVISLPHIIRFGHALGKGNSPLTMRQKIPHQLFMGITLTDREGVRFCSMESFDIDTQTFVSWSPYEYVRYIEHIAWACTQVMKQMGISYGLDIGILSEYPKWFWTSFNTLLFTLLALTLFLQEKKLPLEVMKNYSFQHVSLFSDIALLASYMKYLATGSAGSCLPFIALLPERNPLFQIGTLDFASMPAVDIQNRLWNLSHFLDGAWRWAGKKCLWWHALVHKDKETKSSLPFDVALIHLWASYESLREKEAWIIGMSTHQWVAWFSAFAEEKGIAVWLESLWLAPSDVYGHTSTLLYMRLFHACRTALSSGDKDVPVGEIISILKDMGFYHCFVEHHYEMISLLTTVFSAQKSYSEEVCAFLPMTTVKTWGTFLAVIPRHGERKTLEKTIDQLSTVYSCPAKIVYATRKEELEQDGWAVLHQYISQDVFSSYITPWTIQLLAGDGTQKIGEYDVILGEPLLASGITFDLIKRKILLDGNKITHKDICSQSATIEIIMYLLDHLGEFIPNRLLPASVYSKNKNEMVSKILLPLQEIMLRSCDEQMEIICSWTLYERTICLKKKPSCIHLIQYVHP